MNSSESIAVKATVTFILVYGSLRTGGIETLIVRMAKYLTKNGYGVIVCCGEGGMASSLPSNAHVLTYKGTNDLRLKLRMNNASALHDLTDVIIVSFDPISAARALWVELACSAGQKVSHLSGVFHPRAYFMTGERKDRIFLNHLVARAVGYSHMFFMNEECRVANAKRWNVDLSDSPIAALPIDAAERIWAAKRGSEMRIVSVGRLVDFKAYNLGAPGIVKSLRKRGVQLSWDIYGSGSLQPDIQTEIEKCGVGDVVCLRGELPYSDFQARVSAYDIFVGIGTAALEAAMVGVPTICATDSHREHSYGFIYELPFGNLGELQSSPPTVEIQDLIAEFACATESDRARKSDMCRAAAMRYEMTGFIGQLLAVHQQQGAKPSRLIKRFGAWLYCAATESKAVGILRQPVGTDSRPL